MPASVLAGAAERLERRVGTRRWVGVSLLVLTLISAPVGVLVGLGAAGLPRGLVVGLGLVPAAVGVLLLIGARRDGEALLVLDGGRCERAFVVRWARPPDGCNVAIFDSVAARAGAPRAVVRLPLVAAGYEGEAWVCGADAAPPAACAVIADAGELIGAGRLVDPAVGRARWERHAGSAGTPS